MPKMLSDAAVQQYHRDGYYFPVPALSREEAAHYRSCLERHEAKTGKPLQGNWRHKTHLIFTWADELAHNPKILDAVEVSRQVTDIVDKKDGAMTFIVVDTEYRVGLRPVASSRQTIVVRNQVRNRVAPA